MDKHTITTLTSGHLVRNNPYPAIMGAAEDISDGYISGGQDTVYLQKFNVNGTICRYGYQYMANIQAPYSEAYKSYRSYWNNQLTDIAFTFKIPVFSDMGSGSAVSTLSNNNNLKALSVTNASLVPGFDSSITEYKAYITSNVSKVIISAELADSKAKMTGTGDINISADTTNAVVKVTAEDGTPKEYKITIIRKEAGKDTPDEITSSIGLKPNNTNISGFSVGRDISDYVNMIKNGFSTSEVKVFDSSNKEITKGVVTTGQKLYVKNNNQEVTYTLIVYGDTNGDGKISTIDYSKIKAHIQGTKKLEGSYLNAADTSKDGKISTLDYSKIKAHIQNTKKLEQ